MPVEEPQQEKPTSADATNLEAKMQELKVTFLYNFIGFLSPSLG